MPVIGTVAPDTPILSSWGNDVATEVNSNCLKKSGGTMTGALLLDSPQSTNAAAAIRYDWINSALANYVAETGGTMTGDLIVGGNPSAPAVGVRLDESDGNIHSLCNTADAPNVSLNRTLSGAVVAGQPWINFVRTSSVHGAIAIPAGGSGIYLKSQQGVLNLDAATELELTGNNIDALATDINVQASSDLTLHGTNSVTVAGSKLGLFGATAVTKPNVTGSRGGNAALASLLTALATLGLITNSTSA